MFSLMQACYSFLWHLSPPGLQDHLLVKTDIEMDQFQQISNK